MSVYMYVQGGRKGVGKTVVRQTNEEEVFSVERPPSGILLIIYY